MSVLSQLNPNILWSGFFSNPLQPRLYVLSCALYRAIPGRMRTSGADISLPEASGWGGIAEVASRIFSLLGLFFSGVCCMQLLRSRRVAPGVLLACVGSGVGACVSGGLFLVCLKSVRSWTESMISQCEGELIRRRCDAYSVRLLQYLKSEQAQNKEGVEQLQQGYLKILQDRVNRASDVRLSEMGWTAQVWRFFLRNQIQRPGFSPQLEKKISWLVAQCKARNITVEDKPCDEDLLRRIRLLEAALRETPQYPIFSVPKVPVEIREAAMGVSELFDSFWPEGFSAFDDEWLGLGPSS